MGAIEYRDYLEVQLLLKKIKSAIFKGRHFAAADPLWGPPGIDLLLLGQGVVPRHLPRPRLGAAAWRQLAARRRRLVERALSQAEALELLAREPRLLDELAAVWREKGPAYP